MHFPPHPHQLLKKYNLHAKKAYSQNFLISHHVLEGIAQSTMAMDSKLIVELGGGLGSLTHCLLQLGAPVLVVEKDPDMRNVLCQEYPQAIVVDADASLVSFKDLATRCNVEGPITVVGNLPYAITGSIFRNLMDQRHDLHQAVVMVQKEVADRAMAVQGTKAYGALTVHLNARFAVERVIQVKPGSFTPAPKVSSTVLSLIPKQIELNAHFDPIVKAAFSQRRKMLSNALLAYIPESRIAEVLKRANVSPGLRAEALDVLAFKALSEAF